ncbi:MAG: type II toxin-antitoxin system PemK/MazF family toxin [Clostridiales bacterium]|jgi:hypothetical protein|nr:type II toxin-antitoxin system PemK/MazF family toxin [Clostridiales bacterium]
MKCRNGDIWLIKYFYEEDGLKFKVRPMLVLNDAAYELIGLKMTSAPPRDNFEYPIIEWPEAGLDRPTTIRTSKSVPLPDKALIRKLGNLQQQDMLNFLEKRKEYFNS